MPVPASPLRSQDCRPQGRMAACVDCPRLWAALCLGALRPGEAQPGGMLVFVFLEKQMLGHPAAGTQPGLFGTQSPTCYSEHQALGLQNTAPGRERPAGCRLAVGLHAKPCSPAQSVVGAIVVTSRLSGCLVHAGVPVLPLHSCCAGPARLPLLFLQHRVFQSI